jgi:hypothetical protein
MTMVTKTAAFVMALCTGLFIAFVGALTITFFEMHTAWMAMLLTAAVLFIVVAGVLLFAQHSAGGRKKLYGAVLLIILLAGAGTVGWGWYMDDVEAAEAQGMDLHT